MSMEPKFDDLIGREIARPASAPYPVSEAMITHWCEALDDDPLRYRDAHGPFAPPTMLHIFNMPRSAMLRPMPASELMNRLDAAGFSSPLATNYEQDYLLPIRPGDVIREHLVMEAVTGPKTTPMGVGYFCGMRCTFTNQRGETVGRQLLRVFKYRPAGRTGAMSLDVPVRPWNAAEYPPLARVAPRDPSRMPAAGDELPPLEIVLTPSRIVAGALASNDYMAVHHDKDTAIAGGLPNIFMNIMSQQGWVGRYLAEWAGPGARLQRLYTRLGVPNVAHDTMTLRGRVTGVQDREITLEVRGRNSLGEPLSSVAVMVVGGE